MTRLQRALGLLALVAHVAAPLHLLVVVHDVCAEHGSLEERTEERGAQPADHETHAPCAVASSSFACDLPTPFMAAVVLSGWHEVAAPATALRVVHVDRDVWRTAPKQSPPVRVID